MYIVFMGYQLLLWLLLIIPHVASLGQECIMRKREREEERGITMNFIKIQDFTHASHVTIFSTALNANMRNYSTIASMGGE